jgi:hypothetical protein
MLVAACALIAALVVAGPAQARVINQTITFDSDNNNCLTGEPILITQTWHIVAHTEIGPDGEEFVTSQQVNSQKSDGIGLISGDHYQVQTKINLTDHPFNAAHPLTGVSESHIIDTGSGADFLLNETLHETINANGEISVFRESGNVRCGDTHEHVGVVKLA